jgi:hypothetical protein
VGGLDIAICNIKKWTRRQAKIIELLLIYLNKFMDKVGGPNAQIGFKVGDKEFRKGRVI